MTIDEMISQLDGACGRLLVASMRDPVVRKAMEMVTAVSIALGEIEDLREQVNSTDRDDGRGFAG